MDSIWQAFGAWFVFKARELKNGEGAPAEAGAPIFLPTFCQSFKNCTPCEERACSLEERALLLSERALLAGKSVFFDGFPYVFRGV